MIDAEDRPATAAEAGAPEDDARDRQQFETLARGRRHGTDLGNRDQRGDAYDEAGQEEPDDDTTFESDPREQSRLRVRSHPVHVPAVPRLAHETEKKASTASRMRTASGTARPRMSEPGAPEKLEVLDPDIPT